MAALTACVSESVRTVDLTPPKQFQGVQDEAHLLDIGVAVLDPNIPESFDEQVAQLINPDIRRAEAQFMPYFAKNVLQSTGNWGAVRVVPRPTHAVDVTVTGKILESDGERLTQEFTVTDARGQVWFTKTYRALASKYAYSPTVPPGIDPFQANYRQLADDMLAHREGLDDAAVRAIRAHRGDEVRPGTSRRTPSPAMCRRCPRAASGCCGCRRRMIPCWCGCAEVREREHLFIDTLDEYYANYHRQMYRPYQEWRNATYSEAITLRELKAQARTRALTGAAAIGAGIGAIYDSSNPYIDATGLVAIGRRRRLDQERRGEKERGRHAGRSAAGGRHGGGSRNHAAHLGVGESDRAPAGHGGPAISGTAPHPAQALL